MTTNKFFHVISHELQPPNCEGDNLANIDNYPDNSFHNIYVQDVFDYIPQKDHATTIEKIYNKLVDGGALHIQAPDLKHLANAIVFNNVSVPLAQEILYPNKASIHTIYSILHLLEDHKFAIINKKYVNIFEYYIMGQACKKDQDVKTEI